MSARCRPCLEALEGRIVPAFLRFTKTNDYLNYLVKPSTDYTPVAAASPGGYGAVVVWVEATGNSVYHVLAAFPGFPPIDVATAGADARPAVAMDNAGNFVVTWSTAASDILAARYDAVGKKLGGTITVAGTLGKEYEPRVAMNAGGSFIVTYTREVTPTNRDVMAQRFDAKGTSLGNIYVAKDAAAQEQAAVVATARGPVDRFAVAYQKGNDVWLKRFKGDGTLETTTAVANSAKVEFAPTLDMDLFGRCAVGWQVKTAAGVAVNVCRVGLDGVAESPFYVTGTLGPTTSLVVALDRFDGTVFILARYVNSISHNTAINLRTQRTASLLGDVVIDQSVSANSVLTLAVGNHNALLAFVNLDSNFAQRVAFRRGDISK